MSITNERQNDWSAKNRPRQHLHSRRDNTVTHCTQATSARRTARWPSSTEQKKSEFCPTFWSQNNQNNPNKVCRISHPPSVGEENHQSIVSICFLQMFFFLLVCLYNVIYKIRCDQKIQFNKKWTNKSIKAQQPASKELHIASDRKRIICKCSTKHMPSLGNVFEMNAPI